MRSNKQRLVFVFWLMVLFCPLAAAAGAALPDLANDDFSIPSMPWLELHTQASVRQLADYLGEQPEIKTFNNTEPGIICKFSKIQVWLTGTGDPNEAAVIERVLISDPAFVTYRGVGVGQQEERIFACYGAKPDYTSTVRDLTWHRFFVANGLDRVLFGVDSEGTITTIGFACTAGGL